MLPKRPLKAKRSQKGCPGPQIIKTPPPPGIPFWRRWRPFSPKSTPRWFQESPLRFPSGLQESFLRSLGLVLFFVFIFFSKMAVPGPSQDMKKQAKPLYCHSFSCFQLKWKRLLWRGVWGSILGGFWEGVGPKLGPASHHVGPSWPQVGPSWHQVGP